ncbi:FkbM family methyltransferase [Patescibacteria group bacterium]
MNIKRIGNLLRISIKVIQKTDNWWDYFKDYFKLNKNEWVIKCGKNKLYLRPNSVDRWIATENLIYDAYRTETFPEHYFETVIDLGANIGAATIFFLNKYSEANLIAIEPNPENFKQLNKNVSLNKLDDKVTEIEAAISNSTSKEVTLYLNEDHAANSVTVGSGKSIKVKNFNFRELEKFIKGRTLLKMDIEGAEAEFFQEKYLKTLKMFDHIFFEYHNLSQKINGDEIEKFIRKNNLGTYERTRNFFYIKIC